MYTDAISLRNPCLFSAPRYPKYHPCLKVFRLRPLVLLIRLLLASKISMEHWWNDTGVGHRQTRKKPCRRPTLFKTKLARGASSIEPGTPE